MGAVKTPKVGEQLQIGDASVYVFEVERKSRSFTENGYYNDGRTLVTCHDDNGNEVEVWFYPDEDEAQDDEEDDE